MVLCRRKKQTTSQTLMLTKKAGSGNRLFDVYRNDCYGMEGNTRFTFGAPLGFFPFAFPI